MQIKGNEFLKNVQKKQEREELEKRLEELKSSSPNNYIEEENPIGIKQTPFVQPESTNPYQNTFDLNLQNSQNLNSQHELDNIMLGTSSFNNEDNKKKYIMLGVVLLVLFLLTIIIIRLLTSDSSKEDTFTSNGAKTSESKSLSNNKVEEDFQKILNQRAKQDNEQMIDPSRLSPEERLNNIQANQENSQQEDDTQTSDSTNNQNISNETLDDAIRRVEEKKAQQTQNIQQTTKTETKKEPVVQKTETKKSVKDLVSNNSKTTTSSESAPSSGYFVQVGAFSKKPADSFINKIRAGNLKYKIYQHEVNGVLYNKVLIGPYPSKEAASQNIGNIKTTLDLANAHVVKF
ncbi:SPOR domain-containing protein [Arcobacter vandammei]|uniref:SPOR domain-containing protein n=1 Tax=Arcobacter vandammei TaxID=2782243 RepID=UPI0018DEF183|nr:SPOR domain-containing protein [Arcobacter vandammei]